MSMPLVALLVVALFEVGFIVWARRREDAERRYQRLLREVTRRTEDDRRLPQSQPLGH